MVCPQELKSFTNYERHKKVCVKLSPIEKGIQREDAETLFWQCKNCSENLPISAVQDITDFKRITKHLYVHARNKERVECPVCNLSYDLYEALNKHMNKHKRKEEFLVQREMLNLNESIERNDLLFDDSIENDNEIASDTLQQERETNPLHDQPTLPVQDSLNSSVFELSSNIEKFEASFALKLSSKYLLARNVIDDIFSYCANIHRMKLELITAKLNEKFDENPNINICDVTETIEFVDNIIGLGSKLDTHYKREKVLKTKFDFIEPERIFIGKIREEPSFYYYLPVMKTLTRLLCDDSVRTHIIHQPVFDNHNSSRKVYKTFSDGKLIKEMKIDGPYILLRVYLDAFACNNPLGSSHGKHKVMGFYYSPFVTLEVGSKRSSIQTLALLLQKDIEHFKLNVCLQKVITDLKNLVIEGIYDKKTDKIIQVRVMCSLGDNLEQVEVCGICQNFSTLQHACRKCLCSLNDLRSADTYSDIHSNKFLPRNDQMLQENFLESQQTGRLHINGVRNQSLFFEFPFFNSSKQLPQCSSHDFLEGAVKLWLTLILENLVKQRWISWQGLERLIDTFPYKGKDAINKPASMASKKMKNKDTRRIIGTFSEVGNLIRSITQILYNHVQDTNDPYWQWLLVIRKFFRFMSMPILTDSQIDEMDKTLDTLMNFRLPLTKIDQENVAGKNGDTTEGTKISENVTKETEIDEDSTNTESDEESTDTEADVETKEKIVSKHKPTVKFKEHFLSHFCEDIRNLGPLPLLNTGSKI